MRVAAPSPITRLYRSCHAPRQGPRFKRRDQPSQLRPVEARFDLNPKTARQHYAQLPALLGRPSRHPLTTCIADLNQLDRNDLLRAYRPRRPPPPRIQRMHAQASRRAKLFAPQTTLLELNYELRCLRPAPPAKLSDFSCSIHDSTSTQQKANRKSVVARMDTDNLQTLTQTYNGSGNSATFSYTWLVSVLSSPLA